MTGQFGPGVGRPDKRHDVGTETGKLFDSGQEGFTAFEPHDKDTVNVTGAEHFDGVFDGIHEGLMSDAIGLAGADRLI